MILKTSDFVTCFRDTMVTTLLVKEIKQVLLDAEFQFKVLGAVLFGSRVKRKETSESGFDLLVMAHDIHPKRHGRGREVDLVVGKKLLEEQIYDKTVYHFQQL